MTIDALSDMNLGTNRRKKEQRSLADRSWRRHSAAELGFTSFAAPFLVSTIVLTAVIGSIIYFSLTHEDPKNIGAEKSLPPIEKNATAEIQASVPGNDIVPANGNEPKENIPVQNKRPEINNYYGNFLLAGKSDPLFIYSPANFDFALKTNRLVLLYFYANWSPACQAETAHLYSAFNGLRNGGVIGLRVDFGDANTDVGEKALAEKFGVVSQNTKIILKDNLPLVQSAESWDKARYIEEINKFLTH